MILRERHEPNIASLEFLSLRYNDDPAFPLSSKFSFKNPAFMENNRKGLEQRYTIKDTSTIILDYHPKTDSTTVTLDNKDGEKTKTQIRGLQLLQLFTEKGTLKYSYPNYEIGS